MKAPGKFDLEAHGASWYLWAQISNCFWPGVGKRSAGVDPVLAQMVAAKGVYCIAWRATGKASPDNPTVQYIGQTSNFKFRMGQFARSAGLWGPRLLAIRLDGAGMTRRKNSCPWRSFRCVAQTSPNTC